jgi:cytochrome c biogenesis protein CcdA
VSLTVSDRQTSVWILGDQLLAQHPVLAHSRVTVSPQRSLRYAFLFGIGYAIGSLSCTLPIFLVVVGSSLASQDLVDSTIQYLGYGLGMGAILIAVAVGAALFRGEVSRDMRRALPCVHRPSAPFLLSAGAHLVYYWLFIAGLYSSTRSSTTLSLTTCAT